MDDLDGMKFAELMTLAKLHNVPGRGTARIGQLRAGIRAARGNASDALRTALTAAATVPAATIQPTRPAAAVLPGKAAPLLAWRAVSTGGTTTVYRSTDGRYEIRGLATPSGLGRTYDAHDRLSGKKVGHSQRRLMDAKRTVQEHMENVERAHTDARHMERARLAGDANWMDATHGQRLQALAEDARREGERRAAAAAPRELSGWGHLRVAYAAGLRVADAPSGCTIRDTHCENCGRTDYESVSLGDQGYSACCNEIVSASNTDCRNHHGGQ